MYYRAECRSSAILQDAVNSIISETISLLKCDRVSVFIYDSKIDMLILSASNLAKPIRPPAV